MIVSVLAPNASIASSRCPSWTWASSACTAELIPLHGIRLRVMHKSEFTVRADKIVRDRTRDLAIVRMVLV